MKWHQNLKSRIAIALLGFLFVMVLFGYGFIHFSQLEKRRSPSKIADVIHNGVVYKVSNRADKEGVVEAWDKISEEKLWEKKVYSYWKFPFIERDTQWVFIIKMKLSGNRESILILNERGHVFRINLQTKRVTRLKKWEDLR